MHKNPRRGCFRLRLQYFGNCGRASSVLFSLLSADLEISSGCCVRKRTRPPSLYLC